MYHGLKQGREGTQPRKGFRLMGQVERQAILTKQGCKACVANKQLSGGGVLRDLRRNVTFRLIEIIISSDPGVDACHVT